MFSVPALQISIFSVLIFNWYKHLYSMRHFKILIVLLKSELSFFYQPKNIMLNTLSWVVNFYSIISFCPNMLKQTSMYSIYEHICTTLGRTHCKAGSREARRGTTVSSLNFLLFCPMLTIRKVARLHCHACLQCKMIHLFSVTRRSLWSWLRLRSATPRPPLQTQVQKPIIAF